MKILHLFVLSVAFCFFANRGHADIEFVQITDPHVFDTKRPTDLPDNRAAFKACIEKVNALHGTNRFSFVAMTGDIGLDSLSDQDFAKGVSEFGSFLTNSAVKTWLFVPGNNDLDGEFPTNIHKYHRFISTLSNELQGTVRIIDLCPTGTSSNNSRSSSFSVSNAGTHFRFLGFDTASFKNENNGTNAKAFASQQAQNVQNLLLELTNITNGFAYVLYHIPEIDDPVFRFGPPQDLSKRQIQKTFVGDDWLYSAWMVSPAVRQEWEKVVSHPAVKGVIAGHFHAQARSAYQQFDWLKTNYSSVAAHKFFVAPPVAGKFQTTNAPAARGFRIYSANQFGNLVGITYWLQDGQFEPASPINPGGGSTGNSTNKAIGEIVEIDVPKGPVKSSSSSMGGWSLLTSFVLVPCSVLFLFSVMIGLWRWAVRKFKISFSNAGYTTMLMVGLTLGAVVVGFASLGMLAHCQMADTSQVVGVGALWALASLAVGGAVGILFGIPRAPLKPEKDGSAKPKTNLEEISDWLTKILIGGSLFSSGAIMAHLKGAGAYFATTVSGPNLGLWSGVGTALIIYFVIVGFFGAYFPMRLYLGRAIDEADNGRSVVADRTGLPETKLDALEAAPLTIQGAGNEFDPIAEEAATEIGAIPLESLTNWRDVRLWAKAKLSQQDIDAAIKGYQKAIEIVPNDAESRLGYAAALNFKGSKNEIILKHLEAAHDSLMEKSSRDLRKNVYKSLVYQHLYLKRPESFYNALRYAREYFTHRDAVESGGLWINIACAYGQAYSWLNENPHNHVDFLKMWVKPEQKDLLTNPMTQELALTWLRGEALAALKNAISREPEWIKAIRCLMGLDPEAQAQAEAKKGKKDQKDDDLVPFKDFPEFRQLVEIPDAPQ